MSVIEMSEKDLRAVRRRQAIRVFLLTLFVVPVVLLVIANTHDVDFDWLFDEQAVPLAAVIGGAWGAGLICGMLVAWRAGWKAVMTSGAPRGDTSDTTVADVDARDSADAQRSSETPTDGDGETVGDRRSAATSEEAHTAKA